MDKDAPAGAPTWRRGDPPAWSQNEVWLLWGLASCGFATAVGFFYIGDRYRRPTWMWFGAFYGVCSVALIVTLASVPRDASGRNISGFGWQDIVGPILSCVALAALVHTVVIHAQQSRRARRPGPSAVDPGAPRPSARATYLRSQAEPPAQGSYAPGPFPPVAMRVAPAAPVEPWASFVRSAAQARDRFHRSAAHVHPGPLREALGELVERVDQSVDECRRIAAGGAVLAEARAGIDTRVVERALAAAEARWGADPGDTLAASTAVALQGQRAAAERLDEVIDDVLDQLRLLDARLGEAVARMLELSARAEAAAAVPELSSGIESLVTDLEALRLAVEETHALEILGSPMTVATAVPEGWDQPA